MPLYDCMLLLKPHVRKGGLMDLIARVGKHVYRRNGALNDIKSYGTVELGYGIKKLNGRYYQGQLMQMTVMTPPSFSDDLHYLNKEDRLLRWLLVKHRNAQYGLEFLSEDGGKRELSKFRSNEEDDSNNDDEDNDDDCDCDDDDNDNDYYYDDDDDEEFQEERRTIQNEDPHFDLSFIFLNTLVLFCLYVAVTNLGDSV